MKKLALLLCLLSLAFGSVMAGNYRSLVIMNKDGSETAICYQDGMKMTFRDRQLTLSGVDPVQNQPAEFVYHFDNVDGFRFSEAEGDHEFSGVEQIAGDAPAVTLDGSIATVSGLTAGAIASVYDTAGRLLLTAQADNDGMIKLDFGRYSATALIVKIGTLTFRTIVK